MRGSWLLMIASVAACVGVDGPIVDAVAPSPARVNADITIAGRGFCGERGVEATGACVALPSGFVNFGLESPILRAELRSWTDEAIVAVVSSALPPGRGTEVYVTVDGRSSNAVTLEVLP